MKLFKTKHELREAVNSIASGTVKPGLVPTMGALHQGHISLVEAARDNGDLVIVSIFVNPTQFNDPGDLDRYPRDLQKDLELLEGKGVFGVFAPDVEEMYPEPDKRSFDLHPLDSVMEGKHRPGHFNGVAQIVSKLFEAVEPYRAYFGQKDFQQLAIIRKLVEQLKMDIEIVACPIIREADGLAMSSRNQLLSPEQRKVAPLIYKTLKKAAEVYKEYSPEELKRFVKQELSTAPQLLLEYFEVVDSHTLKELTKWDESENKIACIAVHLGEIRLIDNKFFH